MVRVQCLLQHFLHSWFKNKYHILSISLLLSIGKVLQDLFLEADLVDFLCDTKLEQAVFIQFTQG